MELPVVKVQHVHHHCDCMRTYAARTYLENVLFYGCRLSTLTAFRISVTTFVIEELAQRLKQFVFLAGVRSL